MIMSVRLSPLWSRHFVPTFMSSRGWICRRSVIFWFGATLSCHLWFREYLNCEVGIFRVSSWQFELQNDSLTPDFWLINFHNRNLDVSIGKLDPFQTKLSKNSHLEAKISHQKSLFKHSLIYNNTVRVWQVIKLLHIFKQTGTLTSLLWLIHLYFEKFLFCIPVDLIQSKHCNNYITLHSWGKKKTKKKLHVSLNQPTYKQYTTIQVWQIKISVQCIMCMAWEKIHSSPWRTEGGCFSPLCRSCLLGRCCGSACSCPCRWRGSCGWSSADARRGWPGSCTGAGGKGRSRSELSGGRWRAAVKWEREEEFIVCAKSENRLVHLFLASSPCQPWWFGTSAWYQPGWKATWTGQRRSVGKAPAPHWWTPPGSAKTSQWAGGSRWCHGNAPASSASRRRPPAAHRPAAPAAALSAGRGGARGWWWTCPLWLLPPGHKGTTSALILLRTR